MRMRKIVFHETTKQIYTVNGVRHDLNSDSFIDQIPVELAKDVEKAK